MMEPPSSWDANARDDMWQRTIRPILASDVPSGR
jgi:hypothetical protein